VQVGVTNPSARVQHEELVYVRVAAFYVAPATKSNQARVPRNRNSVERKPSSGACCRKEVPWHVSGSEESRERANEKILGGKT
jgi:hypothetical protein